MKVAVFTLAFVSLSNFWNGKAWEVSKASMDLSSMLFQSQEEREVSNTSQMDLSSMLFQSQENTTIPDASCSFLPNQDDLDYCTEHNFLPHPEAEVIQQDYNNSQPFSIRASDFIPHHSNTCASVHDLVDAIRYGSRRWDPQAQNLSLLDRESFPSTYVPHGCDIPLSSPKKMCAVLNRFSHVIIQGDSLSRHVHGGLLMGLRNDLIRGSLVQSVPSSYHKCRCDAQFTEHNVCRGHAALYNRFKPYQFSLCPELDVEDQFEAVFNVNRLQKGVYNFPDVNCTSPDSRGILVIAQGGIHMKYNARQTYNFILQKFLKHPIFRTCAEQNKAMLIWTSYQAQSESYHELFPYQSLRAGLPFNEKMAEYIERDKIHNLVTMDWLNFTTGAQHTDGLHFAAQANYFKAQHLVAVTDLMWKEKMFVDYPKQQ